MSSNSDSDGIVGGWAEYEITGRGSLMSHKDYEKSYIGAYDVIESIEPPSALVDAREELASKLDGIESYTSNLRDSPWHPDDHPLIIPPLSGGQMRMISLTDTSGLITAICAIADAFSIKIEDVPASVNIHSTVGVATADHEGVERLERETLPHVRDTEAVQLWTIKQLKKILRLGQWPNV